MRGRGLRADRRWTAPALGNGLVVGVLAACLLSADLTASRWFAEMGLVAVAVVLSVVTWRLRWSRRVEPVVAVLVERMLDIGIVTAALLIGGPAVASFPVIAIAAMLAVTLTMGAGTSRWVTVTVTAAALVSLAVTWWGAGLLDVSGGLPRLAGAAGLVVGLVALVDGTAAASSHREARQTIRLRAVAEAARRLSLASDHRAVAVAVIDACRETYPDVTYAAVLLLNETRTAVTSLPVYLAPSGVVAAGTSGSDGVPIGQGISGRAMSTGTTQLVRNRAERASLYAGTDTASAARLGSLGGGEHILSAIAAPLRSPTGEVTGVLVLNSHVREGVWDADDLHVVEGIADEAAVCLERVRLYDQQRERAATDPLTGLRNRRHFEEALAEGFEGGLAILVVDIDNLKRINDENGHEAGDQILAGVAGALAATARSEDVVARIGGDEFAVVIPRMDLAGARNVAQRMRRTVAAMAFAHGPVRISIGCAGGTDPSQVRRDADAALVEAKRQGRDRVSVHRGAGSNRRDAIASLRAIFDGGLAVTSVFQPIVRVATGEMVGVEALARLSGHETDGVEELFAAAHANHRLRDLDWVCRRAALAAAASLHHGVPVFVNVSAAALLDPVHQVDQMLLLLRWADQEPESVVLEITERETVADMRRLRYVLAAYREWGFRFAVDDIGEGHSTLELLAAANPDFLKLARSLVVNAGDAGQRAASEAAVAFARASGTEVIAEGVESEAVAERVQELGIELGQGWWLGMPAGGRELRWGRGAPRGHPPERATPPGLIPFPVEKRRRGGAGSV